MAAVVWSSCGREGGHASSSFSGSEDICEAFVCLSHCLLPLLLKDAKIKAAYGCEPAPPLLLAEWMSHSSPLVCTFFCRCSAYRPGQGSEVLPGRRVGQKE